MLAEILLSAVFKNKMGWGVGFQFATEPVPILLNYISVSKTKTEIRIVKLEKILEFYGLF